MGQGLGAARLAGRSAAERPPWIRRMAVGDGTVRDRLEAPIDDRAAQKLANKASSNQRSESIIRDRRASCRRVTERQDLTRISNIDSANVRGFSPKASTAPTAAYGLSLSW